jgi:hypothetical protein
LKDLIQICNGISFAFGLNDDVIYVDFENSTYLLGKDKIHDSLVRGSGIPQTKGHYIVTV